MKEDREKRQREWSESKRIVVMNYKVGININTNTSQTMSVSAGGTANSTPMYTKVPLYLEMEQKFRKNLESEELQKRKMILQ